MHPEEIIEYGRIENFDTKKITPYFEFKKSSDPKIIDENLATRSKIVDLLLTEFSNKDIRLIRLLFDEELKCELETRIHHNLYQLCFYLYSLGNLNDIYRIYTAKFDAPNMDVGISLDREMLYMNHLIDQVIEFTEKDITENTDLKTKYPKILEELYSLKNEPDYESEEDYNLFIRGYFFGHENISSELILEKKKWWKFWK